ncbi:MAG TPA: gamma-glutamylputrescine oxidoreductase, partial [Marinobacter adhaerens]|nr:gamma-glutamylputrescine oxidoreductase [Marinobacter adhaerens]
MIEYPPVPSYYAASANSAPVRPALRGSCEADVCVVGAGYTGLSTALFLAEAGFRVVVLEAATVGWGASGRNGGQIVNSFSRDLDSIERQTSQDHLKLLSEMAFEGSQIIRQRVKSYGIRCDLKEGGIFAALNPKQLRHLESQQALWRRFGYDQLELLDRSAIRSRVGTERYVGGAIDHTGGHIHPLNLALGEAAALESRGGVIHEHSTVTSIAPGKTVTVKTDMGEVRAQTVVLAGNAYLGGLVPEL